MEGGVKTTPDDAAMFREECIRQQSIWGLTDWTIQFWTEPAPQGCKDEAMVDLDCDTRHAKMTYYIGVEDALSPIDVARHEILHLATADMILAAIHARDESDPILGREEHKFIERALKVWK
jgi:hypothetical protein